MSGISSFLSASAHILSMVGPYQITLLPSSITANPIVSFFFTLSPLLLIVLGVVVFFAGKLAKFVGIVIAILGLVELVLPYLVKVV